MQTPPRIFDVPLPSLTLEAGATLPAPLLRGWWWGPEGDASWLAQRARVLSDAEEATEAPPAAVVTRSAQVLTEARRLAEAARTTTASPAPDLPTVLIVHALTGDMRAGGEAGWWAPVVGPGKALDPSRYRLLCFNNFGSCYGSSGPADAGYPSRLDDTRFAKPAVHGQGSHPLPEADLPATLTTWDLARGLLAGLDALGIERVHLATGGSIAGMIVLALGALDPERFERLAPIAAAEAASPWIQGWSHIGRQAILADPGFPRAPHRGLELARQLAHLSYRAEPGLQKRQGRAQAPDAALEPAAVWSSRTPYRVGTYLEHHGSKLRARFNAAAYLAQLDAMDHHDLARPPAPPDPGETWPWDAQASERPDGPFRGWQGVTTPDPVDSWGLRRIRASVAALSIDSDQLFYPEHMVWLTERLRVLSVVARHWQLRSAHGHDAFLIEWDQVTDFLEAALALPAPSDHSKRSPLP